MDAASTAARLRHDERGQTATEFALVLPVFCVLLFGIIQFGILFNNYVTLTDAVRAGARKATVSRLQPGPCGIAEGALRSAAGGLDQGKLVVSCASSWQPGADVTVEASYPYEINLLGWVAASGQLKSKTTERVE
jgi:Flp pilus assembly protein TadG